MSEMFDIGDRVVKHSGKPFKKAETQPEALKYDIIESFCENPQDPLNRPAAFMMISRTAVSLYQLKHEDGQ